MSVTEDLRMRTCMTCGKKWVRTKRYLLYYNSKILETFFNNGLMVDGDFASNPGERRVCNSDDCQKDLRENYRIVLEED